jgi:hypothetical protein
VPAPHAVSNLYFLIERQVLCCRGVCSEVNIKWSSSAKILSVLFCCRSIVVLVLYVLLLSCRGHLIYMATIRIYLHDVFLMLVRVEGAHGGEGGALGQRMWRT